jgi:hypothetical protein
MSDPSAGLSNCLINQVTLLLIWLSLALNRPDVHMLCVCGFLCPLCPDGTLFQVEIFNLAHQHNFNLLENGGFASLKGIACP